MLLIAEITYVFSCFLRFKMKLDWVILDFPDDSDSKESCLQETRIRSLGWGDPLEKEMATCSSILAWENPMDRGAWQATVHGVAESDTTE